MQFKRRKRRQPTGELARKIHPRTVTSLPGDEAADIDWRGSLEAGDRRGAASALERGGNPKRTGYGLAKEIGGPGPTRSLYD